MTFDDFCRLHGVILDRLPPLGVWKRYKTEDKPQHRNGAVKFMGDHGFVQNHATMQEVAVWKADSESRIAKQRIQNIANDAAKETQRKQQEASQKAAQMLSECELRRHPYLERKGFPEEVGNVRKTDEGQTLLIPMRVGRHIVGVQCINEDGEKKFLYGQRCANAEYVFSAGAGVHVLCEGYATALSIRTAMQSLKRSYTLHVCFSAGNMLKIAHTLPGGVVIADNDASGTGQKIAEQIGWPYWMSDQVGEDANDFHQRKGLFSLTQGIQKTLISARRT